MMWPHESRIVTCDAPFISDRIQHQVPRFAGVPRQFQAWELRDYVAVDLLMCMVAHILW